MPIPPFIAELRRKVGHDLLFVPTIVVIVRDVQRRLLVLHDRDADMWTVPGGIVEPGETPADAAVREVWEEARLNVSLTGIAGVIGGPECYTHYSNGDRVAWVATVFTASVNEATPIADGGEIIEAKFVSAEELARMSLRADSLRFLEAERLGTPGCYFAPPTWRPERG